MSTKHLPLLVCWQVKVGTEVTTGTGPNKKVAKRNAAEAMLLQLGYKASTPLQNTPEKVSAGEATLKTFKLVNSKQLATIKLQFTFNLNESK